MVNGDNNSQCMSFSQVRTCDAAVRSADFCVYFSPGSVAHLATLIQCFLYINMADGVVVNKNQFSVDNDIKENIGTIYLNFLLYFLFQNFIDV